MTQYQVPAPNALVHDVLHSPIRSEQALLTELQLAGHANPDQAVQQALAAGQLFITDICPRTGYRQFQPGPLLRQVPQELLPPAYLRHTGRLALEPAVLEQLHGALLSSSLAGCDDCADFETFLTLHQLWGQLREAPAHVRAFVRVMRKAPPYYQHHYRQCLDNVCFSQSLDITDDTSVIEAGLGVLTFTYDRHTTAATVRATLRQDPYLADHLVLLYHQAVGRQFTAVVLLFARLTEHERLLTGVAAYCQQYHQHRGFVCQAEEYGTHSPLGYDAEADLHESLR